MRFGHCGAITRLKVNYHAIIDYPVVLQKIEVPRMTNLANN